MRRVLVVLLLLEFTAACGPGESPVSPSPAQATGPAPAPMPSPVPAPSTAATFLSFNSTPGDLLGRGQSRRLDGDSSRFFGGMLDNNRALRVTVLHNGTHTSLSLRAQPGQVLMPGTYRNASRLTDPFLDFAVDASTCRNSGEFEVLEAVYGENPSGFAGYSGTIARFRATFRQTCTASPNDSITGEVRLVDVPMG